MGGEGSRNVESLTGLIPPPTPPPAASVALLQGWITLCTLRAAAGQFKHVSHNLVYLLLRGGAEACYRFPPQFRRPFPLLPLSAVPVPFLRVMHSLLPSGLASPTVRAPRAGAALSWIVAVPQCLVS